MSKANLRQPAALFFLAAAILATIGVIFLHSDWPPRNWPKVFFTTPDFGQLLVFLAGTFAGIGLLYVGLTRFLRLPMKPVLGYIHFAVSTFAVVAMMFLDYWFNITYKRIPGEDFWSDILRDLGESFRGTIWAIGIFAAAQIIFLINVSMSIYWRVHGRLRSPIPA